MQHGMSKALVVGLLFGACGSLTAPDATQQSKARVLPAAQSADMAAKGSAVVTDSGVATVVSDPSACDDLNLVDHDGCSADGRPEVACWTPIFDVGPLATSYSVFVYEAHLRRFVLAFGAAAANCATQDCALSSSPGRTWIFDPSRGWYAQEQSAPASGADSTTRGVYDATRQRTLLVASDRARDARHATTWIFDERETWSVLTPGHEIAALRDYGVAYDADRDRVLVIGGVQDTLGGTSPSNAHWELGPDGWIQQPAASDPAATARQDFAFAYHSGDRRSYLFGGIIGPEASRGTDMWAYDGTDWLRVPQREAKPSARSGAAMIYHERRGSLVLYGGQLSESLLSNEAWEFRRGQWRKLHSPNGGSPPRAHHVGFAYNTHEGYALLFGGDLEDNDAHSTAVPAVAPLWKLQWVEPEACPDQTPFRADAGRAPTMASPAADSGSVPEQSAAGRASETKQNDAGTIDAARQKVAGSGGMDGATAHGPSDAGAYNYNGHCRACEFSDHCNYTCPTSLRLCEGLQGTMSPNSLTLVRNKSKASVCVAILDCIHATQCAVPSTGDCLCQPGDDPRSCPCDALIRAGTESSTGSILSLGFQDLTYPTGAALSVVESCDMQQCIQPCLDSTANGVQADRDQDGGVVTASGCTECERTAACPRPPIPRDCSAIVSHCETLEGSTANNSPAPHVARAALCKQIVDCIRSTHCAKGDVTGCLCGPPPSGTTSGYCFQGPFEAMTGPCSRLMANGAESEDVAEIDQRSVDSNYALGAALKVIKCDKALCTDSANECL
jgi:hypothetical protein